MKEKNQHRFLFAEPSKEVVFDGFTGEKAKERIDTIPVYKQMKTPLGRFLQRIVLNADINKKVHMPFRSMFFSIDNYNYRDDCDYYLIVPTMSLIRWELDEIKRFKDRHHNVELILLILDSLHAGSKHLPYVKETIFSDVWDLAITYDRYDAEEFGFVWLGYVYYPQCDELPQYEGKSDAFYLGFNKGKRNKIIGEVYDYLTANAVDCDFRVVAGKNENDIITEGLSISKERYSYSQVAAMAKNSNCIVEVLMDGQKTQSYRYFEAITYNKKLLTNNPSLQTLPYYDERFMKYFEKSSDIDADWVKRKEVIDYGYKGEFAQIHLIDFLESLLDLR